MAVCSCRYLEAHFFCSNIAWKTRSRSARAHRPVFFFLFGLSLSLSHPPPAYLYLSIRPSIRQAFHQTSSRFPRFSVVTDLEICKWNTTIARKCLLAPRKMVTCDFNARHRIRTIKVASRHFPTLFATRGSGTIFPRYKFCDLLAFYQIEVFFFFFF